MTENLQVDNHDCTAIGGGDRPLIDFPLVDSRGVAGILLCPSRATLGAAPLRLGAG
jgi:hypothetical protein